MGQEQKQKGSVAISAGISNSMGPEFFKDGYKMGFNFNIAGDRIVKEFISIGGGFTYAMNNPDVVGMIESLGYPEWVDLEINIDGAGASIVTVNPYIRFILTPKPKTDLSAIIGVGFYHWGLSSGAINVPSEGYSEPLNSESKSKIGLNFGGRFDFPISSKLKLVLVAKYHIMFTEDESKKFLTANFGIGIPF